MNLNYWSIVNIISTTIEIDLNYTNNTKTWHSNYAFRFLLKLFQLFHKSYLFDVKPIENIIDQRHKTRINKYPTFMLYVSFA